MHRIDDAWNFQVIIVRLHEVIIQIEILRLTELGSDHLPKAILTDYVYDQRNMAVYNT